jgi:hypothetical protein
VALPSTIRHSFSDGVEGWQIHDPMARRVEWLGRETLMLGGGEPVIAPVAPEPPYTMRAHLSGGPGECYAGFCFHLADRENFETIYLAPHAGGRPEAIQYDPVMNGSTTWQVFGDADGIATTPLRREHWHVLRIDVWPRIAEVYVDDECSARARFPLRSGLRAGGVGLWGYLASYVSDFEVQPLDAIAPPHPDQEMSVPEGTVLEWLIRCREPTSLTDPQLGAAEHNGTLCFNRFFRAEPGSQALAACQVHVLPGAGEVSLELGYSDGARVWLNDDVVHEGEWRWDPDAGTDGRIRPGHVRVPLVAVPGWHDLRAQVTPLEPGFGWGLTARIVADGRPCEWRVAKHLPDPEGTA